MKELNQQIKEYLLLNNIGIKKAISMDSLAEVFQTNTRKIRSEIEILRQQVPIEGFCLVSHNEGYWLTQDTTEIKAFLKRYLGTAASQFKTAKQTIKQLNRTEQAEIQAQFDFEVEEETELQRKYKHAIIPSGHKTEK